MTDDTTDRLLDAVALAVRAHRGQVRKGSEDEPYVLHPIAVARMLSSTGADHDTVVAGLLHDVVEDSDTPLEEIATHFGQAVASLVDQVTDTPAMDAMPRPERKARQAEHMAHAAPEARHIKIADQTSNIEDLTRMPDARPPEGHAEYRQGAIRVVDVCRGASPALEARFDAAVAAHARATESP